MPFTTLFRSQKGNARRAQRRQPQRRGRLRFEGLENRIALATLNAQYNVELQTHEVEIIGVPTTFDHLSLLLTPQDPSLYDDQDSNGFADQDPLFRLRSDGSYALSLGAGPELDVFEGDVLVARFNRDNDIEIHPAAARHTLTKPAGFADSRAWANALISRLAGYGDNLEYDFYPELTGGFNSNSFIAGLLNATGTTTASPGTIFAGRDYPGYATPVPTAAFGTAPAQRIDLVFVIDTTGSMNDDIAAVKSSATEIINDVHTRFQVDATVDARIAVMDFRDFPEFPYGESGDYPFHDVQRFTSNADTANSGIQSLALGDGGDLPESVFSGLMHAIQSPSLGSWRGDGVSKFIIWMGDAPGHDPEPFTGYTTSTVITAAENEDPVVIFPVMIGSGFNEAQSQAIATGTGGQLIRTANASTIVSAIRSAIDTIARTPVAEAGGPYTANVGVPVTLSAAGSFDPDGSIVRYEWDWESDGVYDLTTTEPTVSHTWTAPFTGRVRLRVTDDDELNSLDVAEVTTQSDAPSNLLATAVSDSQIDLTWQAPAGAIGFDVFVWTGSEFALLETLSPAATAYRHTGLGPGTFYLYAVRALYADGSYAEDYVSTLTLAAVSVAPDHVTATPSAPTQIDLSWGAPAGATGFDVFVWTDNRFSKIATLPAGSTSFRHEGLLANTFYLYAVRALFAGGADAEAYARTVTPNPELLAPSHLRAQVVNPTEIDLSWHVQRNVRQIDVFAWNGSRFLLLQSLPGTATFTARKSLTPGSYYLFAVRALYANGDSAEAYVDALTPV